MWRHGRVTVARVVLTSATIAWAGVAAGQVPGDPFATCRDRFRQAPRDYESAYCFYRVTFEHRLWDEGSRLFDDLIATHPDNAWLVLAYGHIYRSREPDRAERLYRRAARTFEAARDVAGEVEARANLANFLRPKGRADDARREVDRVVSLAGRASDPLVKAQAWILQAAFVQETGGDLGVSYRLLKQAQDILPADPPYLRERALLIGLGAAAFRMGRLDEALTTYRRLEALATAKGEPLVLANARYNILNTAESMDALVPTPDARARLTALAERSLATAVDAQNLDITIKSHRALADLSAFDAHQRDEALRHARSCIALAARARQPADESACWWIVAALEAPVDAAAARAAGRKALDATSRDNNPRTQAYSAGRHMRLSWLTRSREEAARDSFRAIDAVETLRALQDDASSSADLFSSWTRDYYWLSGRLLRDDARDVARAFSVAERMRARTLVDALGASRTPLDASHPAVAARRTVLAQIAAVQRVLMDPGLDAQRRAMHLRELDRGERDELEARRQVALAFPGRRDMPRHFARLEAVQAALGPGEALLSFQVGLWRSYAGEDEGGSWLVAVTRAGTSVHRLPDRARLAPAVPLFNGLLERGEGGESAAAVSLYDALLAEALSSLPAGITRLVIVPDGVLHQLAFDALRASPRAPPLGARYEIVFAPSATLWLQGRAAPRRATAGRTLVLADPAIDTGAGPAASERSGTWLRGLRLGALPHAREESRAIARYATQVDTLLGRRASEHEVKTRDLRTYDVVHFAAHAVADEARPDRSAVLLAPGTRAEDGLLQAREIAALDIDETIVVLSACQTAAGAVLSGEGVLSLARAFFEGGARAVIGTRWPLRDADAAILFEAFYRRLAQGATLAGALKAARDEVRAAGLPPSAWAGLILLGDGDVRPFAARQPLPRVERQLVTHAASVTLALTIVIVAGIVVARGRAS